MVLDFHLRPQVLRAEEEEALIAAVEEEAAQPQWLAPEPGSRLAVS